MLDLEVLALFVSWCFMLFTEMNQGFFVTPETTPYASLKDVHNNIKEEATLLKAALDALNAENNPLFAPSRELLKSGEKLYQRYENIRGNENMSFRDNLFLLHAYRISLTFARLNIAQTLSLFTFPQMQAILDAPIPVQTFYFFSVAFLGMRLSLNIIYAAKHALDPSPAEEEGIPFWSSI